MLEQGTQVSACDGPIRVPGSKSGQARTTECGGWVGCAYADSLGRSRK